MLSRQVETLKGGRSQAEPDQSSKLVLAEIKALTSQVEALKGRPAAETNDKVMLAEIKTLTNQVEALRAARPVHV